MKIKGKVSLGVTVLFIFLVLIAGGGLYSIYTLESETDNILKDNYKSLKYMNGIIDLLDSVPSAAPTTAVLDSLIALQEENITEPGEANLTTHLRAHFEMLRNQPDDSAALVAARGHALSIQLLNMHAIEAKSAKAVSSAQTAYRYLTIFATLLVMVGIVIIFNLPGYIANPIAQLTRAIKSIARKNYEERLYFSRDDEFGELAEEFNQMAEKLDEYEHSNLAEILFEKKRIETIINRMNDPVLGLDQKNYVVFANQPALELLHLAPEYVIDKYAPDLAVENDLLRTLIRTDTNETKPLKIVVGGKEHYYSRETATIEYQPTGEDEKQSIGRVILLRDITTFQELDLAKTNFIATISHELKTPIASLQMCSQLLNDERLGKLNDEQLRITTTLREESERLSRLVNELLDMSQAETGKMKLAVANGTVDDLVERAIQGVAMQAQRKNIAIEKMVADELPTVLVDVEKTIWVLTNLLTNAIRHSPENGGIEIAATRADRQVRIDVTDHGTGIETKYMDRLFDRFFQVPGAVSGTGLGLTIAKEIIEAQRGTIRATSELGKGSCFSIWLPTAG
jgi:NtrC-family two-component system sensor histidine kinase KinB